MKKINKLKLLEDNGYKLTLLEIDRLWGWKHIVQEFHGRLTILVGDNGCGKTSILEILKAVLSLEFDIISSKGVKSVNLKLINKRINSKEITLSIKRVDLGAFQGGISYDVILREGISGSIYFRTHSRGLIKNRSDVLGLGLMTNEFIRVPDSSDDGINDLNGFLKTAISLRWLPVSRNDKQIDSGNGNRNRYVSEVDKRLVVAMDEFKNWNSKQINMITGADNNFQKRVLFALLTSKPNVENPLNLKPDRLDQLRASVDLISSSVSPNEAEDEQIDAIFDGLFNISQRNYMGEFAYTDVSYMAYLSIAETLVRYWEPYRAMRNDMQHDMSKPLRIIERFIKGKTAHIDEENSLYLSGQEVMSIAWPMNPLALSSGEKQIILMLLEAHLGRGSNTLLIVDEPEISIHVKWQEMLIESFIELNPGAQLVIATHSPDIIAQFGKFVKDVA